MKSIAVTWLVAGSLLASASPGAAADLGRVGMGQPYDADARSGTFAGARFRLPLGRGATIEKARVGLTVAPMLRTQGADGRVGLRIGEGVGIGFAGSARPQLTVGGRSLAAFSGRTQGPDKKNASGISTLGGVALVGAGVLLGLGIVYVLIAEADDESDCDGDC